MKIQVTEKHIANGQRGKMCDCPIALAIKDALPHTKEVYVGMRWYIWLLKSFPCASVDGTDYKVSQAVKKFAIAFDNERPVKPFSFLLGRKALGARLEITKPTEKI